MAMGRPTKWKEEYCQMLIDHLAQGYSIESFGGDIGVTRDCIYKWFKEHEQFLYSKTIGLQQSRKFYEKIGLAGMTGKLKGFNASTWIFTMKNRFNYHDNAQITEQSSSESTYKKKLKEMGLLNEE